MAKEISKERLLALLKILFEQTDDQQGLTMEEILSALEDAGISAERKALYRDFDALCKAGIEVSRLRCRAASSSQLDSRHRWFGPSKALGRKAKRRGLRNVCLLAGA